MKFIILLTLFSLPLSSIASIGIGFKFGQKTLNGVDDTGLEGKLLTIPDFYYKGFEGEVKLSEQWHFLFEFATASYSFKNEDDVIAGETSIELSENKFGMRYILFAYTAFRFYVSNKDDIGFEVNSDDKAVIYKENLTIASIFWDQLVYTTESFLFGFDLGADIFATEANIQNRTAFMYSFFTIYKLGTWGSLKGNYQIKTTSKQDDDIEYTESDKSFGIEFNFNI